jgi:hypothetical protein
LHRSIRSLVSLAAVLAVLLPALPAGAGHQDDPRTRNLRPLGHIVEPAVLGGFGGADPDIHTDLAFWGDFAFQGNWDGFNIRDISDPRDPSTVSRTHCDGNQGDIVVWRDILVRSWNTPAAAGLLCDGQPVPEGFEGIHVFDISNMEDPELVAELPLPCGSHTATGVPDRENDRLLIYNNASSEDCPQIDVVKVPFERPDRTTLLRSIETGRACHDTGVILGRADLAGCAGHDGFTMLRVRNPANPRVLYSKSIEGVEIGHSAAFTWDGEVFIFGHEPGGGVEAQCEATDPELFRTYLFFDARSGERVGKWTLQRTQTEIENCTLHNLNTVPLAQKYVLVHGSYQAGTGVVNFTRLQRAREIAWSDPPPRPVPPDTPFCCDVGGAWSSYWYNGFIYESNINEGLNIFRLNSDVTEHARKLRHLNPQTQEFTLPRGH